MPAVHEGSGRVLLRTTRQADMEQGTNPPPTAGQTGLAASAVRALAGKAKGTLAKALKHAAAGSPHTAQKGSPCFPILEKKPVHISRDPAQQSKPTDLKNKEYLSPLPVPGSVGQQWGASGTPRTEKTPRPVKREAEKRIPSTSTASSRGYTSCKPRAISPGPHCS